MRPDPQTLVPDGFALDQALDVSLDGGEPGQIVIVSHTVRKDKQGQPAAASLPEDCPSEPVAGSPCSFRIEVFAYEDIAGWISLYIDDHGDRFAGAEQALTVQSFSPDSAGRHALIVTSDRATGVGSGTGPAQSVLSMEAGEIKVPYASGLKSAVRIESGVAIFEEPHYAEGEPFCCPSGRQITKVGLDPASGEVRVLDVQIVPLEQ